MNATCPNTETLRRYRLGEYSDDEGTQIEQHLADCPACEETLAEFDDTNDSLIRHLPLAGGDLDDQAAESAAWLQRLKAGPPSERDADEDRPAEDQGATIEGLQSYELTGVLGRGGMGVVYRARHRQLNRPVAIKVVTPRLVSAAEARRRFDREIQILGGLHHPGIVSATDAGRVGPAAFLVMELIDGTNLSRLVQHAGPLDIGEACEVAQQMATALAAAHTAGAIHRDVKPSNVMIDRSGNIKLLDFGLAHVTEAVGDCHETSLGRLLGTLDYMAPEQADGAAIDSAADLYGLGATLFFLLTGGPPHATDRNQSLLQQLQSLASDVAPQLKDRRADVPAELSELVSRLLSRDVTARPGNAGDVAEQLKAWADPEASDRLKNMIPAEGEPTGESDALESLSELLGAKPLPGQEAAAPTQAVNSPPRSNVIRWLAGLAGLAAAIWFGVTVLIETPEGTLKIESEVAGIQVELLDEQDHVKTLRIEQGENSTVLTAGQYRVRIADGHDELSISPQTIELRKNGEQMARVTRIEKPVADTPALADSAVMAQSDSVLYQGEPASVWEDRFQRETNPVSRIEAAKALVSLTKDWPADKQVDRIVEVGGELIEDGWGDGAADYLLREATNTSSTRSRWSDESYPDVFKHWDTFSSLVVSHASAVRADVLAEGLAQQASDARAPNAAFAGRLLLERDIVSRTGDETLTSDIIVGRLRRDDNDTLNQAYLLIRARYFEHASDSQRTGLLSDFKNIGEALAAGPANDPNRYFVAEWVGASVELGVSEELIARVVLQEVLRNSSVSLPSYFPRENNRSTFRGMFINRHRPAWSIRNGWLAVANTWLENHSDSEHDKSAATVIHTIGRVLPMRLPSDDWPVTATARLLESRLKERYVDQDELPADSGPDQPQWTSNEDLLACLVLCGGEIPAFVKDHAPTNKNVQDQRALFDQYYGPETNRLRLLRDGRAPFAGVLQAAPFHTVKRALATPEIGSGFTLAYVINSASSMNRTFHTFERPPMEPLLLLAISAELTGIAEVQDIRIAELFNGRKSQEVLLKYLTNALESSSAVRQITEKWLNRMRQRTISETLRSRIDNLLPVSADGGAAIERDPENSARCGRPQAAAVKTFPNSFRVIPCRMASSASGNRATASVTKTFDLPSSSPLVMLIVGLHALTDTDRLHPQSIA